MIRFNCDYNEGAHPRILQRLIDTNFEQTAGYGEDPHCDRARELILKECGNPNADVYFLVGGTQVNLTVIAASLRPYQGALTAESGHINVHESGAIEATGHKVLALPSSNGKITAEQVENAWHAHFDDETAIHMVQPKMVYISHPTEIGTLYTKDELTAISEVCRKRGLYLYMDGARMGYGLTAPGNDLSLADIAN
ncbi:MAG: aminotransferase class I/II-fold pyridoxal phosphate-dependent enzyme, partial [Clostridia bacterium]|nr:aminotransferase class I/II-fold pyridoxal phosphate-dependent enzyme [Clostridia bacterium]